MYKAARQLTQEIGDSTRTGSRLNQQRDLTRTFAIALAFNMEVWLNPVVGFDFPNAKATIYGEGRINSVGYPWETLLARQRADKR